MRDLRHIKTRDFVITLSASLEGAEGASIAEITSALEECLSEFLAFSLWFGTIKILDVEEIT